MFRSPVLAMIVADLAAGLVVEAVKILAAGY